MHSPNIYPASAMDVRRTSSYRYPEPTSPNKEPSTRILQSLLYNFAHSSYLNSSSRNDNNEEPRDTRIRPSSRERTIEQSNSSPRYQHLNEPIRNRMYCQEQQAAPPYIHPAQRGMPQLSPTQHMLSMNQYDPQPTLSRYYQGPSATITSQTRSRDNSQQYPENYLSPRNRSSSIGSAGSSFRDSRSPSHDSTASRDSMSRCSPMSIGSSPSPSPPTQDNSSKLLGILKGGSYNYPYSPLTNKNLPGSSVHGNPTATVSPRHNGRHNSVSDTAPRSPTNPPIWEPVSPRYERSQSTSFSYSNEKRSISELQDEPIDLSVKPKRKRLESIEGPLCSPSVDSGWGSDYFASSSVTDENRNSPAEGTPRKSILESILCGRLANDRPRSNSSSPISKPGTPSRFEYPLSSVKPEIRSSPKEEERTLSTPASPQVSPQSPSTAHALPMYTPPSPVPSIGSQISVLSTKFRCPWRQRVTLAKKNLLPVSARVSDWLLKIIDFAKSQPEFSGLPETDKVTLIQQCWTRLMLLYMAETNFQFAVTPVHEEADDGRPPAISGIDPSEPTMDSVELVQNFIKKCQVLQVDSEEFKCLKMYTLFHSGCSGLENSVFVDNISSKSRQALQDHVKAARPDDKLRYSNLLLYLHTLFGVNCGMVQTLFCKHVAKNNDIDQQIKAMVLKHDSLEVESEDDNESLSHRYSNERSKSVQSPTGTV